MVWLSDVVTFAVSTGFRRAEICNLRWSGVNLQDAMVTVETTPDFRSKSGHERRVPVSGEALAVLERRASRPDASGYVFHSPHGGPLDPTYLSKRFKKYAGLAGLHGDVTFHTLRHTYASWLVSKGHSPYKVKELLGHSNVEQTQIYAHLAPDELRAAVDDVFGGVSFRGADTPAS